MRADLMNNAQAINVLNDMKPIVKGLPFTQIGSGGTIFWNPNSTAQTITTRGMRIVNPTVALGHEILHAFDSNTGALDTKPRAFNGGYEQTSEIRASYFGNQLRRQLGLNYFRSHYSDGGASLLKNGNPVNVPQPELQNIEVIQYSDY